MKHIGYEKQRQKHRRKGWGRKKEGQKRGREGRGGGLKHPKGDKGRIKKGKKTNIRRQQKRRNMLRI
jgi:hypothetical protein